MRNGLLGVAAAAGLAASASAGVPGPTFIVEWSGASFGNGASAMGTITFAAGFPANPTGTSQLYDLGVEVAALDVTVSGAAAGNGVYSSSQFDFIVWNTAGATLDLTTEVVGQATPGGPWGQTGLAGANGDFNIFGNNAFAPLGTFYFELSSSGGSGEQMALTSFRPIPAPGAAVAFGLGGLCAVRRRR